MTTLWKLFCTTENIWISVWSDTQPDVCPNNDLHEIVASTINILNKETEMIHFSNLNKIISSDVFTRIVLINYHFNTYQTLKRIKCIAYCTGTTTSFTFKLVDLTTASVLLTSTSENTTPDIVTDLGVIEISPTDDAVLELIVKRDNGSGSIYIDNVSVLCIL
jgi:hypothetical protein